MRGTSRTEMAAAPASTTCRTGRCVLSSVDTGRLMRTMAVRVAVAFVGCGGDPSERSGSQIVASAGGGSIGVLLLTPCTGCLAQAAATSYFLDGAPLPLGGPCGANSGQLTGDRSFVIEVQNHGDRAEMVVADMFPGTHASIIEPADGWVAPEGAITVTVRPAPAR